MGLLVDADAGSEAMFWGHGGRGYINLGNGEKLTTQDVLQVAALRKKLKKGKLGEVWLRGCDTCTSKEWVNAWLEVSDNVYGFTSITTDGPVQHWEKPVTSDPKPLRYPWALDPGWVNERTKGVEKGFHKKDKKKDKKKGKKK